MNIQQTRTVRDTNMHDKQVLFVNRNTLKYCHILLNNGSRGEREKSFTMLNSRAPRLE